MKNNQQKGADVDLITPLLECVTFLVKILVTLLKDILVFSWNRFITKNTKLEKINYKGIHVKKKTKDSLDLGIDVQNKRPIKLSDLNYERHTLISGATGYGKTNLLNVLQEHSLLRNKPIIFIDPKGDRESLNKFIALCKKHHREYLIFLDHHPDSIKLNPIIEGSITQVIDRIMNSFDWGVEPFYKECARSALLKALKKLELRSTPFSFEAILKELRAEDDKDIKGLVNKLELLCESDFSSIINGGRDDWTLSKVRTQKKCLYIGLSVLGYANMARSLGKLFLNELNYLAFLGHRTDNPKDKLKNPISVYFDEFGSVITPEFIELFNKCRDVGIEITIAKQSTADITRLDQGLLTQLLDNVSNIFILKQRSDESASIFSKAIGTFLTYKETQVIDGGEIQNLGTRREVNELLVHPDIIKNLNQGQAILLRQSPTRLNLLNLRLYQEGGHHEVKRTKASQINFRPRKAL